MCSLDEDGKTEFIKEEESGIDELSNLMCQKCNTENAAVRLRQKGAYCNGCFLTNTTHKFRATLGKSKIVRRNDTILVAYDGTAGSAVLLNLIKAGMNESVHKRLVVQVKVLYIDDGLIRGLSLQERQKKVQEVYEIIEPLGFESFGLNLSDIINSNNSTIRNLQDFNCISEGDDEYLWRNWNELIEETSRADYLKKLRCGLIISAAKRLKCQKIFLADDAMSLAVSVLSNVSLGRGAQLSSLCGFMDNRDEDVMILRPIRDFSRHEILHYLKICDYKYLADEKITEILNPYSSIQATTRKFVTDLEEQFSGTVSTIVRTGEKISAGSNSNKTQNCEDICLLCNECLDTTPLENSTSAVLAANFSKIVSSKCTNFELDLNEITRSTKEAEKSKPFSCAPCACKQKTDCPTIDNLTYDDVKPFLCYGCQLIFHQNFDINTLPSFIINSVKEKIRLRDIATEIQDFLL